MKTSMCPPHASPTENATSSATPKAATLGWPDFNTFCASSNTAPSMQPFDTEPAILPDLVTTIFEPRGRGLEPQVSTTVASATCSPASVQAFSSVRTSRISPLPSRRAPVQTRQHSAQVVKRLHVVCGQEVIAVRKRRHHATRERLVALGAEQRIEPDEPVRRAPEVYELGGQLSGVAAIPTIADDDHHGPVTEHASRPAAIEIRKRVADASAPAEVMHSFAHGGEGAIEVAMAQQPGDAREASREHEGFEILAARYGVRKDHEQARVALHRAAHVTDQDERPPAQPRPAPEQPHELAAGTNCVPGGSPQVDRARPRRTQASRAAFGHTPGRLLEQAPDLLGLLPGHRIEVLLAQKLLGAVSAR